MNETILEVKKNFFYNALENGWEIKKTNKDVYILKKPHQGKKEVFSNEYLSRFLKEHIHLTNISTNYNNN